MEGTIGASPSTPTCVMRGINVSRKKARPTVYIDIHEARSYNKKPCKTAAAIMASPKVEWRIKGKAEELDDIANDPEYEFLVDSEGRYDATADYVVVDKNGEVWGIERKTNTDCVSSIQSNRIYGQVAELIEKFGDHAIFLLEENHANAKWSGMSKWRVKETALSFANHRTFLMPTWVTSGPTHSARTIVALATGKIRMEVGGRGVEVRRVDE